MKRLLIDENGIMYCASLLDIRDLRAGIRKPSTVLPSLERVEMRSVTTDEWERREYLDFLCNVSVNERKYKAKKVRTRRGFVSAYRYLQPLIGFQDGVAVRIDGKLYFVPMADALGYTLGLESRDEVRNSAGVRLDNLGVTTYLIVV
ncbi:hypothetical protein BV737P3_00023 [Phocaeicola phage BV737P3]|nr:hypothetical protein BV737P3_00023 [Phocaeicola phage BV737P3]